MLFGAIGTAISRTVITLGVTQFFKSWTLESLTWVIILQSVPYLLQQILCAHCRALTSPTLTMDLLFNLLETSLICFSSVPCLVLHTCPHMACLSHSTDREVALMMLMTYLSYMLAELFDLSGIPFGTLSFLAETFIFLYVGMDVLDIDKWRIVRDSLGTSVAVSSILIGLLMLGRAAFVFPLSFLSNLAKKNQSEKINFKMQVVIWWSGLIRGAVLMALAYNKFTMAGHTDLHEHAIMITSTITVCLFSTMVFGMLTKPLRRYLFPHQQGPTSMLSDDNNNTPKSIQVPLLDQDSSIEEVAGNENLPRPDSIRGFLTRPTKTVHYYWRQFDDSFMRPVFGGRGFGPFVSSSPTERGPPGLSGA
ncbi:hypothetical protein Bca4012_079088 [Brassica carinata]